MTREQFFVTITPYFVFNRKIDKINEEFRNIILQIEERIAGGEKEEDVLSELISKYKV